MKPGFNSKPVSNKFLIIKADDPCLNSGSQKSVEPDNYSKFKYENQKEDDITIFPNPNQGYFHVILIAEDKDYQKCRIEILNDLGILVNSINSIVSKEVDVDISGSPKGIYIIKYIHGNQFYYKKFVIN